MMKVVAMFQFLIGFGWVLGLAWMVLALASISTPVSALALVSYWGGLLLGPALLMGASLVLMFRRGAASVATFASLLGAAILVGVSLFWVGPAVLLSLHNGHYRLATLLTLVIAASVLSGFAACFQWFALRRFGQGAAIA